MGEMVEFPSNGQSASGYLATPGSGSGPGIVVIQEWWGLVPHIKDVCDRLARDGFTALAVDLYHGSSASNDEPDDATATEALVELVARGAAQREAIGDDALWRPAAVTARAAA